MNGRAIPDGRVGRRIDRDIRHPEAKFRLQQRIGLIGEKLERSWAGTRSATEAMMMNCQIIRFMLVGVVVPPSSLTQRISDILKPRGENTILIRQGATHSALGGL